jgi:hypothetical protein
VAAACRAARHSIWISQLAFDPDCVSAVDPDTGKPALLLDALIAAATGPWAAQVRILLNGSILMNTGPALRRALAEAGVGAERVSVRGVSAFPRIMHAKLVVVDGAEAFLVGSPFVNGYWDDGRHQPVDLRRTGDDLAGRPIHDVTVRVTGPVVGELAEWFGEMWEQARGEVPPAPRATPCALRAARTIPAGAMAGRPAGATEILEAYLEGIGRARSLIYLENQYFSARPIRDALCAALDAHPALEVVLVLNQNPDITFYRAWQQRRLSEGGFLAHPRVGVFSLWVSSPSPARPGRSEVTQLFIHSKVGVVDDRWATVGTANLDGASLRSYGDDFTSPAFRRVFRDTRNFDLNVVSSGGEDALADVATLRRRLWSSHLGLPEWEVAERPVEGWLPLWRSIATENASSLARGGPLSGHVLPYTSRPHPRAQLRSLGIDVERARIDLRFDPSAMEVLWSPGWVKKLVPERIRRRLSRRVG